MSTTYTYATRELGLAIDGKVYEGRIVREFEITHRFPDLFFGALERSSFRVAMENLDGAVSLLLNADDRRGSVMVAKRWNKAVGGSATIDGVGRLSSYELGDEVILEGAVELPSVLLTLLPKETVTVQVFPKATDLGFPIPVLFGNVKHCPLTYVFFDLAQNVYLYVVSYAGVTPTFVYRDGVLVDASEYTIYNGTYNNSVGGVGGNLTAYCVIRFAKEQRDFQGRVYDRTEGNRLTADVTGLQPERNFARAMRSILSNTTYGLGESVDATSFNLEEANLDSVGNLFCDGILLEQRTAKDWLDELAMVRGLRFWQPTVGGAWTIKGNSAATAYAGAFGFNDPYGFAKLVEKPIQRTAPISEAVSSLDIEYRYDPVGGQYLQVSSARTLHAFGQPKRYPFRFIRHHITADKVADWLAKSTTDNEQRVSTVAGQEAMGLLLGDRIVVAAPRYGMYAPYEIRGHTKRLATVDLELVPYHDDLYTYTPGTLPVDETPDSGADLSKTPPSPPSNLTKPSQGSEQATDGTTSAWVDLSWTASPTSGVTYVVQLKKNGESTWTTWDEKDTTTTRIRGLIPGLTYDFQVLARSPQNLFSLTAAQLLSQLAPGDTTAPPIPGALTLRQGTGRSVEIDLAIDTSADWAGYKIYRNTTTDPNTATLIDSKKATKFHDVNISYGVTYFYWARSFDLSGNISGFAVTTYSITPVQVPTSDVADNAITADGLYTNAGSINVTDTTEVELGSLTISTVGGSVLVLARCHLLSSGGYPTWTFRIRKDSLSGTILDSVDVTFPSGSGFAWPISLLGSDSSPAASQTYKLTGAASPAYIGPGTVTVKARAIVAFHRKK